MKGGVYIFTYKGSFNSSFEQANTEVEKLFDAIQASGYIINERLKLFLSFAIRELFNNAVEHGNKMDELKNVSYSIKMSKEAFEIQVFDCGCGFDLTSIMQMERGDILTRNRNRGIIALIDIGFILNYKDGCTYAKLYFKESEIIEANKM